MRVAARLIIQFFSPINLIIMMSLKAKHRQEGKVNGAAEPFILLSYALTYKQQIKHVRAMWINVFLCAADVSDEARGSSSDFHASSERDCRVGESLRSLVTHFTARLR